MNKHDGTIDEEFIEFPRVQTQPNTRDCGVFAIAFAVSLLFNILPDKVTYKHALMRQHLLQMFQSNSIEHFPSNQNQQLTRSVQECESAIGSKINKNPSCGKDPAFKIGKSYITTETDNKISPLQNVVLSDIDKEGTIYTTNVIQTDSPLVAKPKISNVYLPRNRTKYMSDYYNKHKEEINLKKAVNKKKKGEYNTKQGKECKKVYLPRNRTKYVSDYYKRNKEEISLKRKAVYKANKEEWNMKKGKDCKKGEKDKKLSNYEYYIAHKEGILTNKKMQYDANKEVICGKRKKFYQLNKEVMSKKRKVYYHEIRKGDDYNKVAKRRAVLQIIKKYRYIAVTNNNIATKNNNETYIRKLSKIISMPSGEASRLEAERIIKWCFHIRQKYILKIRKLLKDCKEKVEVSLTRGAECLEVDDRINALCGQSGHTSSSESYYAESSYHTFTGSESIILNSEGKAINVLPVLQSKKKTQAWHCSYLCKTKDVEILNNLQDFFKRLLECSLKKVHKLNNHISSCSNKTHAEKLGHSHGCYINPKVCKSNFLAIEILAPHFLDLRHLKRMIYKIASIYKDQLHNLDKALNDNDLETLERITLQARKEAEALQKNNTDISLNEEEIISRYYLAFRAFTKRFMDTRAVQVPGKSKPSLARFFKPSRAGYPNEPSGSDRTKYLNFSKQPERNRRLEK